MPRKKLIVVNGKKIVKKGAAKIKDEDFEKVLQKSEAIKNKFKHARPLGRFVEDLILLLAIVKDYIKGNYRKIPRWSMAAIVFTLLYVLNPFDLIPDFIIFIGYLDDAAVVAGCLYLVEQDLKEYKEWKINK
jgi:uncharacterized membrane protein YkvA (DUF1232 family)